MFHCQQSPSKIFSWCFCSHIKSIHNCTCRALAWLLTSLCALKLCKHRYLEDLWMLRVGNKPRKFPTYSWTELDYQKTAFRNTKICGVSSQWTNTASVGSTIKIWRRNGELQYDGSAGVGIKQNQLILHKSLSPVVPWRFCVFCRLQEKQTAEFFSAFSLFHQRFVNSLVFLWCLCRYR